MKIVEDAIYVGCRDQIVILRDLNGDGETDFYECFNNDHQVTEHFHEFAMGLQTDAEGNFYYAKAARHALQSGGAAPRHAAEVSKDGAKTEILATGFRAANGVCLNPDGTFFLTDQEGFWMPKNRINLVERGGFYGNMWGYHDVTDPSDAAMKQPLCWITNAFDRSPAELLWVDERQLGAAEGIAAEPLLRLRQGLRGAAREGRRPDARRHVRSCRCRRFPTGVMRGRFHPDNGQLYCCGMFAWAGNQTQPGGFYRVRYTGKPVHLPVGLNAKKSGMAITFSGELDPKTAGDPKNYAVKTWSLKRSEQYGSKHYDEKPVEGDGRNRFGGRQDGDAGNRTTSSRRGAWRSSMTSRRSDGSTVKGFLHNTIHHLGE